MPTTASPPDLDQIRARFPALDQDTLFLENAGGSQVPADVVEAMTAYLSRTYVQLGAPYALSQHCTRIVADAHEDVRVLMNATDVGQVVLGHSSSALFRMLADCYAPIIEPGDEIVVHEAGHEANIGPWLRLEERGARIRWWRVDPETGASSLEALREVLSPRTRLVAVTHVSNLLGEIVDVAAVTAAAHAVGARVVVDGVAYAPHRAIDVAALGVDWYGYSAYKVYGPHVGALFGRTEAFAELVGPNHFFVPRDEVPYKFELGGVAHESCAGLLALRAYLQFLAGREVYDRRTVTEAFAVMEALERPLQARLVAYLEAHPRVRIVGPAHADAGRVATVSFVHAEASSASISHVANERQIGIRFGHMYAHRLCTALGLDPEDGVVRVSCVHYNTPQEIERLIEVIDPVL